MPVKTVIVSVLVVVIVLLALDAVADAFAVCRLVGGDGGDIDDGDRIDSGADR